jgi:hypothetical protein
MRVAWAASDWATQRSRIWPWAAVRNTTSYDRMRASSSSTVRGELPRTARLTGWLHADGSAGFGKLYEVAGASSSPLPLRSSPQESGRSTTRSLRSVTQPCASGVISWSGCFDKFHHSCAS